MGLKSNSTRLQISEHIIPAPLQLLIFPSVYNKKNFHYTHCIADPAFPSSLYYRQSETEPFGPRLNFEDTSTHMFLDESGHHVTTDKGFRMAKANVGVREGRWYWECKITSGIPKRQRSDAHGTAENRRGHVRSWCA